MTRASARWSQDSGSQSVEYPSFKEAPSFINWCANGCASPWLTHNTVCSLCSRHSWSLAFLRAAFVGAGGGNHYSWPCPCLISCSQASCSWWVWILSWGFTVSGPQPTHCDPLLHCRMCLLQSCSPHEHTLQYLAGTEESDLNQQNNISVCSKSETPKKI